ncbi:hypothetical protein CYLTODRAFT_341912 [Cylindrobasidium torrendii FP15055 ss-10]|uniref:Trypsin-like serine protease n=1 Tax=Cylindrobasidium torrendii FP15055 ss-10 TaxID=1314674 RepID=A0A0D7BSH2_9AGAR|nr:hypothetical protein CYLTODRAFT_341912 [Cylindrobasidium torrendii FP15055 ss-10]
MPRPPIHLPTDEIHHEVDREVLNCLARSNQHALPRLMAQYSANAGHILESQLPYESRPPPQRRVDTTSSDSIVLVAHAYDGPTPEAQAVTLASGFMVEPKPGATEPLFVSCAHTLEQVSLHRLVPSQAVRHSGSAIVSGDPKAGISTTTVTSLPSSFPRSDVILLSTSHRPPGIRSLPVSPYPAAPGTRIRAHFVSYHRPADADGEGWTPWIGGTYSKWVSGTVLGYRDFAGTETKPGTYDALSHMLFNPLPTPGSSGGPIIDEESGAVVGIMLGTRMDNRVEGVRGWGVPAESIFEMFSLPGLNFKQSS